MIPDERIEKVMDRYVDFLLKEMDKPEASLVEINDGIRLLERNRYILEQFTNKSPVGHGEGRDTEYYAERFHKRLDKIYQDFLLLQQEATQEKPDGLIKRFRRFIGS